MILKTSVPVVIEKGEDMVRHAGTRRPAEICDAYHIQIRLRDLQRRLKAYYFYIDRIHKIVMDENITDSFRDILLAHELGHFALHKDIAMMKGFQEQEVLEKRDSEPLETEANLFAAELLLPDDDVLTCLEDHTFFETAAILRVPAALLDFKYLLLRKKGYSLNTLDIRKSTFLKEDLGAYTKQTPYG